MASNSSLNIGYPSNDMEPCLFMDPPCLVHRNTLFAYFIAKLLRPDTKILFLAAHGYSKTLYGNTTSVMDMIYQRKADMTAWFMTINRRRHDNFEHLGPLIRSSTVFVYRRAPSKSANLLELSGLLPLNVYFTTFAFILLLLCGKFILLKGRFLCDVISLGLLHLLLSWAGRGDAVFKKNTLA